MDVVLQDFHRAVFGLIDVHETGGDDVFNDGVVVRQTWVILDLFLRFFSTVVPQDV